MLGFGMLAAYLFIRAHTVENDRYDVFDKYVDIMICVGAFASFVVFEYYAVNFQTTLMAKQLANVQWSNNISTLLMITMPFPLYRAKKSVWWLGLFATEYAAILLAASRGGWLMGSLELVICLIVSFLFMDYGKRKRILIATAGILVILVGVVALVVMLEYLKNVNLSIKRDESRTRMFVRSFENLMTNPIFGIGISSGENADLYAGKQGTMVWYHMMIPQVVGSMGILGIVCYFKQFKDRLLMVVKNAEPYVITLGLSYMGLLLMSQVNPGEFCPLPYTLLAVVTFVLIEKRIEKRS
jgi:O-antigen ligase